MFLPRNTIYSYTNALYDPDFQVQNKHKIESSYSKVQKMVIFRLNISSNYASLHSFILRQCILSVEARAI